MSTTRMGARVMAQQNEEHFETIDKNKAEQYQRQKITYLEDRIKVLEKSIERLHKMLPRLAREFMQEDQGFKDIEHLSKDNGNELI